MKNLFFKLSVLFLFTSINNIEAQQRVKKMKLREFYIIDTIRIENPYIVTFIDTCSNNICGRPMILGQECLNVIDENNLSFNEAYEKQCGYPTVGWFFFNYMILVNYHTNRDNYLVDWENYDWGKILNKDSCYKNTHIQRILKYSNEINQFLLILVSVERFNNYSLPELIPIHASGYLLVVVPILPSKFKVK